MTTYYGPNNHDVYLGSPTQNPVTLAVGGVITNVFNYDALYGNSAAAWNFTNFGTVRTTNVFGSGVHLAAGGTVTNASGALITGAHNGVYIDTLAGTVTNSGTIKGTGTTSYGIHFTAGGSISNAQNSLISGAYGGVVMDGSGTGTIRNLGTIAATGTAGTYRNGVFITGGTVVNGASNVTSALISSTKYGVVVQGSVASTVNNFGTIKGGSAGNVGVGVYISGHSTVVNGASNSTSALISGSNYAIKIAGAAGSVSNFGTIISTLAENPGAGVYPDGIFVDGIGSTVVNGAANATSALISATHRGVYVNGGAVSTISNFGRIQGTGTAFSAGIYLNGVGIVSNAQSGLITGTNDGIVINGAVASTVTNSGTITGGGANTYSSGVYIKGSGTVVNGGPNSTAALIRGGEIGVGLSRATGTAAVANFGTIIGGNSATGIGVYLSDRGSVVNGASNVTSALISGGEAGIKISGASGTVTNFGTVTTGANGTGIYVTRGQVTNYGTIIAPSANAVIVRYGQFVNRGLVQGLSSGIVLSTGSNTTGGGRVTVSGTVSGATGLSVTSTVNTSHTVTVGGTVIGTSGTAVSLSPLGGDRLIVTPGAAFQGTVNGGGGASVLEVTATAASGIGAAAASSGAAGFASAASAYVYVPLGNVTNFSALQIDASAALDPSGVLSFETLVNQGRINIASGDSLAFGTVASSANAGVINLRPGGLIHFRGAVGNQMLLFNPAGGTAVIDHPEQFAASITHFEAVDAIDLALGRATFQGYSGGVLSLSYAGTTVALSVATQYTVPLFTLADDGHGGTQITVAAGTASGPHQSPVVLSNFGWAQGWGSPNNPRMVADVDGHGATDYIGFGFQSVFVAYGGTFSDGQGHLGHGFTAATGVVNDFGTNEGYAANVQRGAAQTGVGPGASFYGQGFAGVYWYAATGATAQLDAAGHTYNALTYQTSPNLYGNFGSQQGWTPDNGFQILKASTGDNFASILGFGNDGIVVGPQAFAPGATAANSYLIPLAAGNNSGWKQSVDIRTFTDANGKVIDLNGDGIADFVGMGPQGLVFALGNHSGPGGGFGLGALQTAHVGAGGTADLGEAQGWNNAATLRYIVKDPATGFYDILAFGAPGVFVTMGQDPATHGGEPFGQLYLAMADFGSNQGWSVDQTPRIVGDVNGDGIPDIVGFGFNSTFAAIGSRDAGGNLHFALDPSQTISDFGIAEGWSGSNPQTIRALADVAGSGHSDLILSGAFNTQVWQYG